MNPHTASFDLHSSQPMLPVRIGVIGAGDFGRLHIQTLANLAEAELVAIVDLNQDTLAHASSCAPGVATYNDLDIALKNAQAQAWVIATRTNSHVSIASKILQAGHAVLIEKPLAENLAAAQSLGQWVKDDSSNVMMGHLVLFAPEFQELLKQIKERGPICYFHAVRHRPATLRTRFAEENPITMTMVHDLYLALAMTNCQQPTSLNATLHSHPQGSHDVAMANIHWANGTWGAFTASFLTPPGMSEDGYDRIEVFGHDWAASLQLNPRPIQLWTNKTHSPRTLDIHNDMNMPSGWLAQQLRCFCNVVQGKASVPQGARYTDALMLMQWMDQLQQSAGLNVNASSHA